MNKQEIQQKATEYFDSLPEKDAYMMAFKAEVIEMITYFAVWIQGQQNQSGMRWVNCAEHLPGYKKELHNVFASNYIIRRVDNHSIIREYFNLYGEKWGLKNFEWLDESASSEVERLRKENEEKAENEGQGYYTTKINKEHAEMKRLIKKYIREVESGALGWSPLSEFQSLIQKIEANGK